MSEEVEAFAVPRPLHSFGHGLHKHILSVMSTYVCRKVPSIRTCEICKRHLLTENSSGEDTFARQQEGDNVRPYINRYILSALSRAYFIVMYALDHFIDASYLKKRILATLFTQRNFTENNCIHGKQAKLIIFNKLVVVLISYYIDRINKIMHGLDLRPFDTNAPVIFRAARELYIKYKKR